MEPDRTSLLSRSTPPIVRPPPWEFARWLGHCHWCLNAEVVAVGRPPWARICFVSRYYDAPLTKCRKWIGDLVAMGQMRKSYCAHL